MLINFLQFFKPHDKKFFPLFEKASANLVEMSSLLVQLVNTSSTEEQTQLYQEISKLDVAANSIANEIFQELSSNFITPIDREDIHALISSINYVVDYIHVSVKRIQLYKLKEITPAIIKLAELSQKSSEELHKAVCELRNLKNVTKIKAATVKINTIENHADSVYDAALAKLLSEEKDMIEVIKLKDILYSLETTTDMCEDAAGVINSILVKNA